MSAPLRIAIGQTRVTTDPERNGAAIRAAMRDAAGAGARLIHLPEGAHTGYIGPAKSHFTGWHIDWTPVTEQLEHTMTLAAELGIWVVVGGNHRLSNGHRPHNSLWVINDRGQMVDRYDKRYLSHNEVNGFYTPGTRACVVEVDGWRLGLLICIEVNFPELWTELGGLEVDTVLFSTFSEDPIFEVIARGYAATHGFWISTALPAQCAASMPSSLIGPHGTVLHQAASDGEDLIIADLDRADPALDIALNKARPWRRTARAGDIYAARRVDDPRSTDRTCI
ncbi:carbon-nitrogen hydrolase family protein [Paractinoplanes ferrugineus]|uniref:Amidohydrolase n=1 Tax=Paractinoplanes ferrugineus TaxID=113564 RepID=A0A919J634_9ACTN|nr:carbon-nitrogen hydrolase family protein [Actinoplanes ferrugineus]GIE14279.1 amidohydrolase [Actinoplanes ferrugineus]